MFCMQICFKHSPRDRESRATNAFVLLLSFSQHPCPVELLLMESFCSWPVKKWWISKIMRVMKHVQRWKIVMDTIDVWQQMYTKRRLEKETPPTKKKKKVANSTILMSQTIYFPGRSLYCTHCKPGQPYKVKVAGWCTDGGRWLQYFCWPLLLSCHREFLLVNGIWTKFFWQDLHSLLIGKLGQT